MALQKIEIMIDVDESGAIQGFQATGNAAETMETKVEGSGKTIQKSSKETAEASKGVGVGFLTATTGALNFAEGAGGMVDALNETKYAAKDVKEQQMNVEKANIAVTDAQNKLNEAIQKYGPDSAEAQKAAKDLEFAQTDLTITQGDLQEKIDNQNKAWRELATGGLQTAIGAIQGAAGILPVIQKLSGGGGLQMLGGAITSVRGILTGLGSAMLTPPILLITIIITAIAALAFLLMQYWGPVKSFFEGLWNAVKPIFETAWNIIVGIVKWAWETWLKPIFDAMTWVWNNVLGPALNILGQVFTFVWGLISAAVSSNVNIIKGVIDFLVGIWNALTSALQTLKGWFESIWNTIKGVVKGAVDFIMALIKPLLDVINTIKGVGEGIYNNLTGKGGKILPFMAEGGVVDRPTLAMVGEGGEREYIIPESKLGGVAAKLNVSGTRGGGAQFFNTFNITSNDPNAVAQQVVYALKRQGANLWIGKA